MTTRPGILCYFSDWGPLLDLDDSALASLFRAAMRYGINGETAEFEGIYAVIWGMIKPKIDHDGDRYAARCVSSEYAVYCREAKRHREEPIPFDTWKSSKYFPISIDNDSIQQQRQMQIQSQNQPQLYAQGEKQRDQRGEEGGGFPAPYRPLPSDTFEKQQEAGLEKLNRRRCE